MPKSCRSAHISSLIKKKNVILIFKGDEINGLINNGKTTLLSIIKVKKKIAF